MMSRCPTRRRSLSRQECDAIDRNDRDRCADKGVGASTRIVEKAPDSRARLRQTESVQVMMSCGKDKAIREPNRPNHGRQAAAEDRLIDTVLTRSTASIRTPLARPCDNRACEGRSSANGEGGIRTHGTLRHTGFRNQPDRPLRHLSWVFLDVSRR